MRKVITTNLDGWMTFVQIYGMNDENDVQTLQLRKQNQNMGCFKITFEDLR